MPTVHLGQPAEFTGSFRLAGATVVGSKRYEAPEIIRAAGLKINESLTTATLDDAANKLASTGMFDEVNYRYETRGDALTAIFTVRDADKLLPCVFENFVWFTPDQLLQNLRSTVALFDGSVPLGGKMLDRVSEQLRTLLEARGLHAQVQYTPHGSLGGSIDGMQFREVGVPVPVRRIEFTGVKNVDPALLQQAALPLQGRDYEYSYTLGFMRGTVSRVYLQRGYLRAKFGEPTVGLLTGDSPNAVSLSVPVHEGDVYRLKEITWSGESTIPYEEIAKLLHAAVGSPVNALQMEQDVLAAVLLFHPKGYLQADLRSETTLDDTEHLAAYHIAVGQGDLFRLGRLEIVGLDEARARSIEQLSSFHPGDPYETPSLNRLVQEVGQRSAGAGVRWKISVVPTIHYDNKTVDVKIVLTPS